MNETDLTEDLDKRGLLTKAHNPGVYALRVEVPDSEQIVTDQWDAQYDVQPEDSALSRLADAHKVAYVGASGNVYERLTDHAAGDVRKTAFLSVFPPTEVIDVWPSKDPFEKEYRRALRLTNDGWLC